MCEKCDNLLAALNGGDKREIDIAEYEWWKEQFSKFDVEPGALVRFFANDEFIDKHDGKYQERKDIMLDAIDGSLCLLTRRLARRDATMLVDQEILVALAFVGSMMSRMFWFGVHTIQREHVMHAFGEVHHGEE